MKNNSMIIRTISGAVLLVLVLLVGILGGPVLLGFVEIVSLIGLFEIYRVLGVFNKITQDSKTEDNKNNILAYAGFVVTALYFFIVAMGGITSPTTSEIIKCSLMDGTIGQMFSSFEVINSLTGAAYINLVFVFVIVMLTISFAIYVFTFPRFNIEKVAYAFISFVYVPVFMSFVYFTRSLSGGKYTIWLIFISAWVCDTCAYFVGTLLGKHKLAPVLSPKKSIEGSIGGVLGAMLVAFLFGYFVEYKLFNGANNAVKYIIICFVGSIVSQVGDLAASAIKRNKDIKDYGNLIPGHGGILDRFDSIIFVAPFVFLLSYFLQ